VGQLENRNIFNGLIGWRKDKKLRTCVSQDVEQRHHNIHGRICPRPLVISQVTPMVMNLSKFTEVLRIIEADSNASENIDSNEQLAAATDRELRGACWL